MGNSEAIGFIISACLVALYVMWKGGPKLLQCLREGRDPGTCRDPGKVQSSNAQMTQQEGPHSSGDLPIFKKNREQRPPVNTVQPPAQSPVQPQQQVVFYQVQTTEQGQTQIVYQQPPAGQQQVVYQQAQPGVGQGQIQIVYQQPPEGQQQVVYQQPTTQPQVVYQTAPVPNQSNVPPAPVTTTSVPQSQPSANQLPAGNPDAVADAPPSYGTAPPI